MSQETGTGQETSGTEDGADHSTLGAYVTGGAEFTRDTNYIEDRITRDGRPGTERRTGLAS